MYSVQETQRIISALRLIFWGGLICLLDFNIGTFDVINDFIGAVMLTWGVFKMSRMAVHSRYTQAMLFTKIVAVIFCVDTLIDQLSVFTYALNQIDGIFLLIGSSLLGIAQVTAATVFCMAMRGLSMEMNLMEAAQSWRKTTILFSVIYLIPLGLFYFVSMISGLMGESFHFNLGILGLPLLILFFVPLIHFFFSTNRMKSNAQRGI